MPRRTPAAAPDVVIVTPALAAANNGNWQTASRWARMLAPPYRVAVCGHWPAEPVAHRGPVAGSDGPPDAALMIALHARRSAASIAAWKAHHPERPLAVVLTGTDLYADLPAGDADTAHSLAVADRLVVLNRLAARALPAAARAKACEILQSAPMRRPSRASAALGAPADAGAPLQVVAAGHLRTVKDPGTLFEAARRLAGRADIRIDHIGAALEPALEAEALAAMAANPHYRWLGGLPHAATRQRIAAADVLVHTSRLEGGAHVVIEAVTSGVAVIASAIDGNLGLLGTDHPALFAPGDAAALAALLERARDDPAMLPALRARSAALAPAFAPAREAAELQALVAGLIGPGTSTPVTPVRPARPRR